MRVLLLNRQEVDIQYRIPVFVALRSFVGGSLLSLAVGVAVALICLAIGLVLRGLLEALAWMAGTSLTA